MRVPLSWMGEYVQLPDDVQAVDVAADLVRVGLEEEAIHGGGITGPLIVGRVLEFVEEPQKNGKTIRWCQVDVGSHNNADGSPRGIVCGARNFLVDDLVVVVLPGAVLPGPFPIAARKTYGHVSDGMICSARELGLGDDHDGIIRLGELGFGDVPVGTDAIALLGLGEETVEVNVTPDRGYALSVRGVAREYAHATGATFHDPAAIEVPKPTDDGVAVRLEDDAPIHGVTGCDRYVARVVRGVNAAAPSPAWMQRRLEQAGMRPISLAVDITNYVMLGLGQPLHAFDVNTLTEPIVVRRARPGEKLTTLDDVERVLAPEDLLITDTGGDRVLALAGVMGGAETEVTDATTDVLIEAAHFESVTVARTSRRHKLSSEASRRFERGVDNDLADRAAELAVRLLVEFGGGVAGPVTDSDDRVRVAPIALKIDLPERIIGLPFTRDDVISALETIGCRVDDAAAGTSGDSLLVHPPSWRPDLKVGVDLVEEVARLRGYDAIPSILPTAPAGRGLTHPQRARRSVSRALAEHGLVETLSYPFVSVEADDAFGLPLDDARRRHVRLANPLSEEEPLLRTWLLPSVLETLRRNVSRGLTDVGVYEVGMVTRPLDPHAVAPQLPLGVRPHDEDLAALEASVPDQPHRIAIAMAGDREQPGWWGAGREVQWADAVEAAQAAARALGLTLTTRADDHAPWHPGRCAALLLGGDDNVEPSVVGHAGELHPRVLESLRLPARTCAVELSLDALVTASDRVISAAPVSGYPVAKEDVALVVAQEVAAGSVAQALAEGGGELLESVRLFDVYTGPQIGAARKSLAFALRMRAPDRTLTAVETAQIRDAAVAAVRDRFEATLRGA